MTTETNAEQRTLSASFPEAALIPGETAETFEALVNTLRAEFQPQNAMEHSYVDSMAVARWRQLRYRSLEAATASGPLTVSPKYLTVVQRLRTSSERQYNCALSSLLLTRKPPARSR